MEQDRQLPDVEWDPGALRGTFDHPGPFLTAYLATAPDAIEDHRHVHDRWGDLRAEAAKGGAPDDVLELVDRVVEGVDGDGDGDTLAVVADEEGVLLTELLPEPPSRDLAAWDALPRLGPILDSRQQDVAHLVVLIDRRGADLIAVPARGDATIDTVTGDHDVINKVRAGSWSHRRMQQRAEDSWTRNAQQIAEDATSAAAAIDARLVVVAGDEHAVRELVGALPGDLTVHVVAGGRAPGGDDDQLAEEVVHVVGDAAARDTRAVLAAFGEASGRHDHAVEGVDATVAALAAGRVAVLLVDDDPDDERRVWVGDGPLEIGALPGDVEGMGGGEPRSARMVDACIRAAIGSGAVVRVVPGAAAASPAEGVGAILRW